MNKAKFNNYAGFVDKFKVKKTTDDCYTPDNVYSIVLDYVKDKLNIEGYEVVRPFYPGGDYENYEYTESSVVIDNPPFSIISKIVRFYIKNNIKFFLFHPTLTLFSAGKNCTHIVVGAKITYDNGAVINTSFVSNMFGNIGVMTEPDLYNAFNELNMKKRRLPKYEYPEDVLTASKLERVTRNNGKVVIYNDQFKFVSKIDMQREHNRSIYGGGLIISNSIKNMLKEYDKHEDRKHEDRIIFSLSQREKEIVNKLK